MQQQSVMLLDKSVDVAISGWVHEKAGLSGSDNTRRAYATAIQSFRGVLLAAHLDLDGPSSHIELLAQGWAALVGKVEEVAPATYNKRLAILSSFFAYCIRHRLLGVTANPIATIQRRKVQPYSDIRALGRDDVRRSLKKIDVTTLEGKRDYALLSLALTTGRRVAELAGLRLRDIEPGAGGVLTVNWRRTKGGKAMRDTLPRKVASCLSEYLAAASGHLTSESTIWLSLSLNPDHRFRSLAPQALERICERRLGTTKFHQLRHTFAHAMEEAGAKVSDIQSRLGHTNIATTGRYLASLRSDENPHGEDVARMLVGE